MKVKAHMLLAFLVATLALQTVSAIEDAESSDLMDTDP